MKKTRYAGYVRVSDPRQERGFSLDAQKSAIERFVENEDGLLVEMYEDGGKSATTTLNRDEFHRMRADAKRGLFDALVVHKFDRLARNRLDAMTTKIMLRKDCGIKIVSASGEPSADTDPIMGGLIEAIMEAMAEFYSINLGQEVRKSRQEMLEQRKWYGGPPYGYRRDPETGILVPDPDEAPVVREIFETYAAGDDVSVKKIARMLNERGLRTRQYNNKGGREWTANTVKMLLRKRTYIGELPYKPSDKHGDGRRSYQQPLTWFPGSHEPLVSKETFDRAQEVMRLNTYNRKRNGMNPSRYLLDQLCWCALCQHEYGADDVRARMGSVTRFDKGKEYPYYVCKHEPPHGTINGRTAERELIEFLGSGRLISDDAGRNKTLAAIASDFETAQIIERIEEIRARVARLDFRFDNGAFLGDPQEFLAERRKLEDEITILEARVGAGHEYALSVLSNFADHWADAEDHATRRKLIRTIVHKVIVRDRHVWGLVVRPANETIILGDEPGVGLWPIPPIEF